MGSKRSSAERQRDLRRRATQERHKKRTAKMHAKRMIAAPPAPASNEADASPSVPKAPQQRLSQEEAKALVRCSVLLFHWSACPPAPCLCVFCLFSPRIDSQPPLELISVSSVCVSVSLHDSWMICALASREMGVWALFRCCETRFETIPRQFSLLFSLFPPILLLPSLCVCARAYVCVRVCMCACVILALNLFADGSAQRLPSHWAPPFLSFPFNSLSVAFLFLVLGVLIQLVAFAVGRFFFFVF